MVLAGLLAGVPVIGYARRPAKASELTDAGAAVLVDNINEITTAIRQLPPAGVAELAGNLNRPELCDMAEGFGVLP